MPGAQTWRGQRWVSLVKKSIPQTPPLWAYQLYGPSSYLNTPFMTRGSPKRPPSVLAKNGAWTKRGVKPPTGSPLAACLWGRGGGRSPLLLETDRFLNLLVWGEGFQQVTQHGTWLNCAGKSLRYHRINCLPKRDRQPLHGGGVKLTNGRTERLPPDIAANFSAR